MHTDFLPTRKIPVSQLYAWNSQRAFPLEIDLSHRGCLIRDQASGTEFLASTDDDGFIRGATLLGETRDHLVYLLLSDMTGCEWVNEYSEQWPHYRCWTEAERDTHARKVAADLADDRAEAEGISVQEAFEIEYQAIYDMHPVTIENWQVAA
ncbi:MAG: hypothetical protein ACPGPC_16440 [Alphaproteobacteria bacterium]